MSSAPLPCSSSTQKVVAALRLLGCKRPRYGSACFERFCVGASHGHKKTVIDIDIYLLKPFQGPLKSSISEGLFITAMPFQLALRSVQVLLAMLCVEVGCPHHSIFTSVGCLRHDGAITSAEKDLKPNPPCNPAKFVTPECIKPSLRNSLQFRRDDFLTNLSQALYGLYQTRVPYYCLRKDTLSWQNKPRKNYIFIRMEAFASCI